MSDSRPHHAPRVPEMAEESRSQSGGSAPERRGSDWGSIAMLDKTKEFFRTCDMEGKGFITRTDMRRLHRELPLSAEELEDVFDSLDVDRNGYLTLGEFSTGFSQFLHGRRISLADEQSPATAPRVPESLYQNQWEAKLTRGEDEEEKHFCMLLDSLGASNVFEDPGEVRSLWARLRRDEPHLLSNFEEFLARVTSQIKEAHQERREMESALQRKAATHDTEIRRLYEEMELQIKNEKDRILLKDSERLQSRSQDLEHQLSSKEKELEHLFLKQRRLERECRDLNSEQQESRTQNVKLKTTNQELSRELDNTAQELALAQEQLTLLQGQAARLHQEREMEMYRVTEGLQREKQSLMKQLDLLREMNKHLKDERDSCYGIKPRNSLRKKQKQRAGLGDLFSEHSQPVKRALMSDDSYQSLEALPIEHLQIVFLLSSCSSEDDNTPTHYQQPPPANQLGTANGYVSLHPAPGPAGKTEVQGLGAREVLGMTGATTESLETGREREGETEREMERKADMLDAPPDGWPLRRVISIEEDHLPHLLHGGPQPLLHQLSEEDEEDEDDDDDDEEDPEMSDVLATDPPVSQTPVRTSRLALPLAGRRSRFLRVRKAPTTARGQPVGKETQHRMVEGMVSVPERLFKVVLVGNSSVGKTSLLRSFCEGRFHPATSATVGIDYSVKTLTLDNTQVAMQLWDTVGQERYRSITKQFFRKADGVVVMYDVTMEDSFKAVRPWLANVQEAAGEVPILLLGNKMDMLAEREVSFKEADMLAQESKVLFFEVSAYTGYNVAESLTHLARVLKDQEDRVRDTTVLLSALPVKKKACCN
ncbi:EF-hand calcium-binding domain-containing protein 4B [Hypomesus transpacificus]|uniref:EF-hand calcium-binding domain-containing protein 4B n=1 Tax=Hypomesus transpacificus TaxID=137520 RepID=UPI001F087E79|nr:EF-hand calcium-binding domain-containing protein 4B [Hypomesus transpacificus]